MGRSQYMESASSVRTFQGQWPKREGRRREKYRERCQGEGGGLEEKKRRDAPKKEKRV